MVCGIKIKHGYRGKLIFVSTDWLYNIGIDSGNSVVLDMLSRKGFMDGGWILKHADREKVNVAKLQIELISLSYSLNT
jgi:hypothetical protein